MSEQTPQNENPGAANSTAAGQFAIQKVYLKDISFEAPHTPLIFTEKWAPNIDLQLSSTSQTVDENLYEVVLTVTVTAKLGDKSAFLVEVQQAGIFTIQGAGESLGHVLGSFCPNILFPFAREAVADLVTRGGFPQLLLAPVNFDALYAQHMQRVQQNATASPETTH